VGVKLWHQWSTLAVVTKSYALYYTTLKSKNSRLILFQIVTHVWELRQCSQDSDYCYRLNNLWFKSQQGRERFLFSMCGLALGPTQPPIQWITGVLSLEVKWLGDEADLHTVPSFKKESIYIFILPAHLLGINSNNLYLSLMFWSEWEFTFSRAPFHCVC